MKHALIKIRTVHNPKLDTDEFVEEVMDKLMKDYPQIQGYQYERTGPEHINILFWGDIEIGV